MATVSAYPTVSSVRWLKQLAVAPDLAPVTSSHTYEDGGVALNESNDTGVQVWELEYGGLTSTQWDVLDAHWLEARLVNDFTFVDRLGVSHTGVRYKDRPDVSFNKYYAQARKITLVKTP